MRPWPYLGACVVPPQSTEVASRARVLDAENPYLSGGASGHSFPCLRSPKVPCQRPDRRPLRGAHAPTAGREPLIRRGWFTGHCRATAQVSGRFTKGHYAPRALVVSLRTTVIVTPESVIKDKSGAETPEGNNHAVI